MEGSNLGGDGRISTKVDIKVSLDEMKTQLTEWGKANFACMPITHTLSHSHCNFRGTEEHSHLSRVL